MAYFVYVHRRETSVPYFEALPETDLGAARMRGLEVLRQHASGFAAELWTEHSFVEVIQRDAAEAAQGVALGR